MFPEPVYQKAEAVMVAHKHSMAEYKAQLFDPEEVEEDTLILTMDESQKKKLQSVHGIWQNLYTLGEFIGREEESYDQPVGQPLVEYGKCYDKVFEAIQKLTVKLNEMDKN